MSFNKAPTASMLIKCSECGFIFGEDEAIICRKCREHICPKCGKCGCRPQREGLHLSTRFA